MCNYNGVCFNSMQGYNRYVCQNCYNLCMGIPNCYESRRDPVNLNYGINAFIPNNIIPSKFDAVTNGYRDNTGVANGFCPTNINVNTHDDNKVEATSSNSIIPPQVTPVDDGTVRHQTQPEVMILYDSSKKFLTIEESISMVPREQGLMPTAKINQSQMNEKVEPKPSLQSVENVVDNTQGKKDKSTLVTGSSLRIQNDEVSKTKSLCSERSKRTSIKQFKSTAQTECKQKDKRISGRNSTNNENQTISSSEKPIIDTPIKDSKEMKPSTEKLKSSEKVSMPKDQTLHRQVDVVQVKPNLKSKTCKENKLKSSNQIASNAKEKKIPVTEPSNKNKTEFLMNKSKNHNDIKGLWNQRMPTCKEVSNFIKKNVPLRNSMEKFSFCKPLNAEQKSLLNKLLAKKRATGGSSHVPGCLHLKLNLESNKKDNIDVNKTKECKRCKKATTETENKLGKAKRKSKLKKKSKSSPGMMADEEPKTRAKNVLLSCNVPLCLSLPEEINCEHLIKAPNENPVVSLLNNNNGNSDLPRSEIQWIRMPPTDVKTVEQPCLASNVSTYMRSFHDPNKTPATHSCPCNRLPLPDSPSTSFPATQQYPSSFQSFLQNSSLPAGPSSYPCTQCNSQSSPQATPQPAPCEEKSRIRKKDKNPGKRTTVRG